MTVLRTDRKHASNCMTEENGVEKVKKRKNFFRSLRFRIVIILIILGIAFYRYKRNLRKREDRSHPGYID